MEERGREEEDGGRMEGGKEEGYVGRGEVGDIIAGTGIKEDKETRDTGNSRYI